MSQPIKNRREYLFLYDVSFANPNGDPNDENKPRIDEETGKNIVTDVRLKRTIRDYLKDFENLEIFVREIADEKGKIQDAKARAKDFENDPQKILNECIDVRLFGGTIPITTGKNKDSSIIYTGPVQFNMGQSLHRVKLEYIKGTGAFASSQGKEQKTFREEWILPYSFIAFHGVANENAAKETNLSNSDLEYLKKGMWEGTKNLITRSKNEQMPRLLIEIIYKEDTHSHIGELHRYIKLESQKADEELRSTEDFILNIDRLLEVMEEEAQKIEKVLYKIDRNLKLNKELSSPKITFEELGEFVR
ncbi:CRISPR-associated protein Csh2 [Nitratiruptor sp. YY08-26]|uniref:type I-B CRISPR-associated protein Cas7/Csh2 n=1 Tax=unclassified Nitratiruptor TaxID=2624044 RepID=UPI0019150ACB|nr:MULTISPECIES: type I-B CRISPR-associated protein Cas7/Csh2 [unclassified Nitratiruptor]BCD61377.1 CRISPR-associated protein Csh2 [Nitratiruptor sp. YY08-13]BCD65311.1 CRISPR-associated protein Csh2 [Nitratiruptor sp. YY08-26]